MSQATEPSKPPPWSRCIGPETKRPKPFGVLTKGSPSWCPWGVCGLPALTRGSRCPRCAAGKAKVSP